jgi:hypothetical protein
VLATSISKHLRSTRRICDSPRLLHDHARGLRRVRPVLEEALQTSGKHLLEANNQHTVGLAVCDHVPPHVQAGRTGRAIIVDVVHGNARHAKLIEHALSAGRVAVAVACDALVDVVVVDVRV